MKRRRLLQALLTLILLAGLSGIQGQYSSNTTQPSSETTNVDPTAVPDHITLSWTSDPKTTMTVTWRTDTTVNTGVVQYSTDKGLRDRIRKTVPAKMHTLKTDLYYENIFTAAITGLKPGDQYYYRVGDGTNKWSPIYSFRTEEKKADCFKFLVFGDTQSKKDDYLDYSLWQTTVHNAYKANQDARFFTVVGDAAQAGLSNIHWNQWFPACKGVIDSISYMPVEGNTETRDIKGNHDIPILYIGQFNVPNNGPFGNCEAYSYDYGNVHFVVLNSQLRETLDKRPNLLEEQKAWLEKDLSQTKKDWKVVFSHKPPYSTKAYRTNEGIKAAFNPIFDKYHVDVVFSGHDHAYARTYPMKNDKIVSSPALGTVYVITGRSGSKDIDDNEQKAWNTAFFSSQDMPNYIVVNVCGSRMEMKAYKKEGMLIDEYAIDKKSGDKPRTVVPSKYNKPRLAVDGVILNKPLMPIPPTQINEKWYLPIKPVVGFLGGSESTSDDSETLSLIVKNYESSPIWGDEEVHTVVLTKDSTEATIDDVPIALPDPVVVESPKFSGGDDDDDEDPVVAEDAKIFLISADDMTTLFGFNWRCDADWNVLFLTNPSKRGE